MRILNLVAGEKWTGAAAVVFDQTAALVDAGFEAQLGLVCGSVLAERLRNIGWARPLLERPPRWPSSYAHDVLRLHQTILREKFDVVHAHTSHDHYVSAFAVAGTDASLVRTLHHLRHARRHLFSRPLFLRTRAFAFANRSIAEAFGASGPIHPPVVDAARYRPAERSAEVLRRFGIPEDRFLVLTVGKMAKGRGHADAISALARMPDSVAAVHVGHGELLGWLKERAAELGAGDRNFWTGYQEHLLPELYRSCDAFLFTASGSEQGQRAILEAMASGLPVVALDLPGVRDLVTDGREGFVVSGADEISGRLEQLVASPRLRAEMSGNARRRALDFSAEKFVAVASNFYRAVIRG